MEIYVIEYLNYLQERKARSQNTLNAYEQDLYQFLRFLQKNQIYRLEKVTETNCNSYLLAMEKEGMKPASITRKLTALRGFFDFCIRRGYVKEDPTERLKAAKIVREMPEFLTKKEVKRLLAAPDTGTKKGKRDRAMLGLLYGGGLQAAELTALKRPDFNRKLGFLRVLGETQERLVPLSEEVLQALEGYLDSSADAETDKQEVSEEEFLFPARSGGELTRQAVWKIVKEYGKKAGMEKVNPQILRNSFAAHLLQDGAELSVVQQRMGITELSVMGRLQSAAGK